jgi:glycosyltransferase involved in cell wall biosynthesis
VTCFNHEQYLSEALESILMQEFPGKLQIIIADDASTDGTLRVAQDYAKRFPELFTILPVEKNLGITKNYKRGFAACEGEITAVLEGDDYWIHPRKLATSVQFLHDHPACAMAFHRVLVRHFYPEYCRSLQWPSERPFEYLTGQRLAGDNYIGGFSNCVYRSSFIRQTPEKLYDCKMYDWLFNLAMSRKGLVGYIPEILSVYRCAGTGAWSSLPEEEKVLETISAIGEYDSALDFVYKQSFLVHKRALFRRLEDLRDLRTDVAYPARVFGLARYRLRRVADIGKLVGRRLFSRQTWLQT